MVVKAKIEGPLVVTMPAGTYFVGDPCYAVPDEDWNDLLDSNDVFEGSPVGTLPNGNNVTAFHTAFGDGVYYDQYGNSYPVDAGLLGVVPLSGSQDTSSFEVLGAIRTFTAPFQIRSSYHGALIEIGDIAINTEGSDEDDSFYANDERRTRIVEEVEEAYAESASSDADDAELSDFGVAEQWRGELRYDPRASENEGRDTRDMNAPDYDPRLALQEYYDLWASGAISPLGEDEANDILLHVGALFGRK